MKFSVASCIISLNLWAKKSLSNTMENSTVSSIINIAAGLAGVAVGALLNYFRDWLVQKRKDTRDGNYLAILVVSHLDRFANGCWHVALDDGTSMGQPAGGDGMYQATVKSPVFKPLEINVEWRSLPQELLYEVLQIPDKQEYLNAKLEDPGLYDPPDHEDYFLIRQNGYAELGLYVLGVSRKLRQQGGLPIIDTPAGVWGREVSMREVIARTNKKMLGE